MIKIRPANERGKTRAPWLDSSHTFSFNRYYDPRWSGFRDLLVINEDHVAPGQGFGTHSHDNMEILSYVVEGALRHRDSSGGSGVIRAGELQRMTAGTGVSHSEFNASETEPVHFLQIWVTPEREGLRPGYEQRAFPAEERRGRLRLVASRDGQDGAVTIHQDVKLYDALLDDGEEVAHRLAADRHAWAQVISGAVTVNGTRLSQGDGAAISEESELRLRAEADGTEVMLFDLA
jgi:quercetin 2,3-dioxygenase